MMVGAGRLNIILLSMVMGGVLFLTGSARAGDESQRVKAQDKAVVKDGKIDHKNKEEESPPDSVQEFKDKDGKTRVRIISKTFLPAKGGWKFKLFDETNTHIDIWGNPETVLWVAPVIGKDNKPIDKSNKVQIEGVIAVPTNAGNFPLRVEGNLNPPPGGRGDGDGKAKRWHWAVKVSDYSFTQNHELWWYGLSRQRNGKPLEVVTVTNNTRIARFPVARLDVVGQSKGKFEWEVIKGSEIVQLWTGKNRALFWQNTANKVSFTDITKVTLVAQKGSAPAKKITTDVTIRLSVDGVFCGDHHTVVFTPHKLALVSLQPEAAPFLINGYISTAKYLLTDQFDRPMPHAPIGEFFPKPKWTTIRKNNWLKVTATAGGFTDQNAMILDKLSEIKNIVDDKTKPPILDPQTPLTTNAVRSTIQTIRTGAVSSNPADAGVGINLRVNTLKKYQDHASIQENVLGSTEIHKLP